MNHDPAVLDLDSASVPEEFTLRIPLRFARENAVVAVGKREDGAYVVALGDLGRVWAADRVAYKLDREVEIVEADREKILDLINRAYHAEAKEITDVADELKPEEGTGEGRGDSDPADSRRGDRRECCPDIQVSTARIRLCDGGSSGGC